MKQTWLFALLCCAVGLVGCSKELSRSKAAKLIQQYEHEQAGNDLFPRQQRLDIMVGKNQAVNANAVGALRKAEKAGWVSVVTRPCYTVRTLMGSGDVCPTDIALTEAGKAESKNWKQLGYVLGIPTMEHEVVEVTGIGAPFAGSALVDYTWRWAPTKYGKAMGLSRGTELTADHVQFHLFDDGWRVDQ